MGCGCGKKRPTVINGAALEAAAAAEVEALIAAASPDPEPAAEGPRP